MIGNSVSLTEFDHYDQALLRAAFAARMIYARIAGGPEGKWIHAVSNDAPDPLPSETGTQIWVVRLADIVGLELSPGR